MPLNEQEVKRYKTKLLELRAEIMKISKSTSLEVKEAEQVKGYTQHQADEGTDDFVLNVNLELSNSELNLLRQIDRALAKTEDGTYGICDLSGDEIPRARLDAIPYATMTVAAQQKFEKRML